MNGRRWVGLAALVALTLAPWPARAGGLGVEVWTDRGDDAVYQPGDRMEIQARTSDDAYLLVYEIDAEGYVRLLYPYRGSNGFAEGRRTYRVPPEQANVDLVVQDLVGQCYLVAIASQDRFRDLPWYLRPYDEQAEQVGYEGMRDDEEGITAEGRIVGDPFVAMERIRRRVLADPGDENTFGSSYATYYVHNQVRYPRYLCYDCHRPGRWAWWPGFDPYYTSCSVFDFRVNWSWGWGPGYWFGYVPYYYYVARYDCPPRYRSFYQDRSCFSAWDGWNRWNSLWGGRLVRYKSPPPPGYVPPTKFRDGGVVWKDGRTVPPGFIVTDVRKGRNGLREPLPIGRNYQSHGGDPGSRGDGPIERRLNGGGRPAVERMPAREVPRGSEPGDRGRGSDFRERLGRPVPRVEAPPRDDRPRVEPVPDGVRPRRDLSPGWQRPRDLPREERAPRYEPPRVESPRYERPRMESPRYERPRVDPAPRNDRPRAEPAPRNDRPREERQSQPQRQSAPNRDDGHRDDGQRGGGQRSRG